MNIVSIVYNKEKTGITVATREGMFFSPWPCTTWHGEEIRAWLDAGGVITDPPAGPTAEQVAEYNARALRGSLLSSSDWSVLPDVSFSSPGRAQEWRDYRQALRDVPDQAGFPLNIAWPAAPDTRGGE